MLNGARKRTLSQLGLPIADSTIRLADAGLLTLLHARIFVPEFGTRFAANHPSLLQSPSSLEISAVRW